MDRMGIYGDGSCCRLGGWLETSNEAQGHLKGSRHPVRPVQVPAKGSLSAHGATVYETIRTGRILGACGSWPVWHERPAAMF
jgi:hypothetical protein